MGIVKCRNEKIYDNKSLVSVNNNRELNLVKCETYGYDIGKKNMEDMDSRKEILLCEDHHNKITDMIETDDMEDIMFSNEE